MVTIVLGVGALGAALMGGGGGYFFWKKTEPNAYDASLFINYRSVYNLDPTSAEPSDAIYWKQYSESLMEDNRSLNVVVIGDYKQGKTFVLNGLSGLLLETSYTSSMEGIKFKKTSWVSSHKQDLEVILIDTEGANHLPGDATNRDLLAKRQKYDQFIQAMAIRLADVPILVADKPGLSLSQKIQEICNLMVNASKSARTVVVVYNMCNIEQKDDLFQFFEREVVGRFHCSKFECSIPPVSYHYSNETVAGETFRIVHLPLGREGSEAGKHFNRASLQGSLRYVIEVESQRREDSGARLQRVREQIGALAPAVKRFLGVILPKDPQHLVQCIPQAPPSTVMMTNP